MCKRAAGGLHGEDGRVVLCLSCTAADLWKQKINPKWGFLVCEEALELGNLLSKHVWGVSNTSDDTDSACVGDGCCELRTSSDVHASEHDWVLDLQEIGRDGANLLCKAMLVGLVICM